MFIAVNNYGVRVFIMGFDFIVYKSRVMQYDFAILLHSCRKSDKWQQDKDMRKKQKLDCSGHYRTLSTEIVRPKKQ